MSRTPADSIRLDSVSSVFWDRYFASHPSGDPAHQQRTARLPYIPGLDGIRALAVAAVLLYHANGRLLPGGFLGVEVFFVLSGYLITSLLLAERRTSGQVDLTGFWLRRARRLLPALFLLLAVTLAYAVVMLPREVAQLRADAAAAALYVMNWWMIFDHKSYFEAVGRPSLLRHLWSLAVEEQFYLIWPPLFVLSINRLRERRVLVMVVAGVIASTGLMAVLYRPAVDPSRLYFGTDTRAAELLVGAALAFVWRPGQSCQLSGRIGRHLGVWLRSGLRTSVLLEGLGFAGLAGIGLAFGRLGEFSPALYRGGFLLVALATVALIAAVVHPRSRIISRVLGCGPLRWIGLRSYGIYLWHWPVYMVTRPGFDVPLRGLQLVTVRVVVTLALVEISYRCVEMPFRSGQVGRAWRAFRQEREEQRRVVRVGWLGVSGTVAMSTVLLGIVVARAKPSLPPPYLAVQEVHIVASPSPALPTEPATPALTPAPTIAATPTPTSMRASAGVYDVPPPEGIDAAAGAQPLEDTLTSIGVPAPTVPPTPTPTATATAVASYALSPTVTAIGDSVMLGVARDLASAVPNLDLDAKVGLQVSDAIQILHARRDAGRLHQVVVLDIGNNGPMTAKEFDQIMQVVGSERHVIFLNLRVPRPWEGPNNDVLSSGVARYPNASLLDWHAATVNHPELFWDDGIHLRPVGSHYYVMLVEHYIAAAR